MTDTACEHCGFLVHRLGSRQLPVCPNNYCPGKFADACPGCASTHKEVRLARVGLTAFTCRSCGLDWDSLRSPGLSGGSQLTVLQVGEHSHPRLAGNDAALPQTGKLIAIDFQRGTRLGNPR